MSDYLTDEDFDLGGIAEEKNEIPEQLELPGWGVSVTHTGHIYVTVPDYVDGRAWSYPISYDEALSLVALLRAVTE